MLKTPELQNNYYTSQIRCVFNVAEYCVDVAAEGRAGEIQVIKKKYSSYLTTEETDEVIRFIAHDHKNFIERKINAAQNS